jgi:hypothetical protein
MYIQVTVSANLRNSRFSHEIYSVYLFSWRNRQVHNCEDIQLYSFIYYTHMFLSIFNILQGGVQ